MTHKRTKTEREKREEQKLGKAIFESMVESLYISGVLSEKDFDDEKILLTKVREYMDESKKKGEEITLTVDYRPSLLNTANKYIKAQDYELAYVFYATFFEHLINGVLQIRCIQEKIPNTTYKELIRKASLEDKFSWVLVFLKLPRFQTKYWKIIKSVSEKRNSFVHYKYHAVSNDPTFDDKEWARMKPLIKSAITYAKTYQTRVMYDGKAKKLRLRKESGG